MAEKKKIILTSEGHEEKLKRLEYLRHRAILLNSKLICPLLTQ